MNVKFILLLSLTLFTGIKQLQAQGCSDAGVCSIHSLKNNTPGTPGNKAKSRQWAVGFGYGKGERKTNNYTGYLEYTRLLGDRTAVTGKIGYSVISGELAQTKGINDLVLSVNRGFGKNEKWNKSFVAGLKIPFNNSNKSQSGIQLPMPYQTSLGTTDLLVALNFSKQAFGASLAWQQPLTKQNGNQFLASKYPQEPLALLYWPSNELERKGDLVGRVSYQFGKGKGFSLRPSLLGIYHLGNDSYTDAAGNRRPIYHSTGLTLNANVFIDYRMLNGNGIELSLGTPFVVREQRPDGLTRKFVASLEYRFGY